MIPGEPARRLSDRQRIDWLRLIRTERVGPATFRDLVNRFGSAAEAIANLPDLARQAGAGRDFRIPSSTEAEEEIAAVEGMGAAVVAMGEVGYPPLLRHIDHPPPLLTIMGSPGVFDLTPVAIVGARNASLAGIKIARAIAADLGRSGHAIVSGLARGIDAAAHEASLPTGTVAALAGGIDRPYPPENRGLYQQIAEGGGALISEMPLGWEPRARDFPRRNRLIAGSSLGLLVVEAAHRSGSLISARLAATMGRMVFAVPGSPLDPRCEGSNGLLKDGATLVTEARDIADQIAPMDSRAALPPAPPILEESGMRQMEEPAEGDRARLLEALGPTPVEVDEIARHLGVSMPVLALLLLELDLAGRLARHPGNRVSLID